MLPSISRLFGSMQFRTAVKWGFYFISRLIFIDLVAIAFGNSVFWNGPKSTFHTACRDLMTNVICYIFLCPAYWLVTTAMFALGRYSEERVLALIDRCRKSEENQWIWFRQLSEWKIKARHTHFPIDILSIVRHTVIAIIVNRRFPLKIAYMPVIVHDFDQTDDPAWPHCSLLHTIALYVCQECKDGNRIAIYRTSTLRRLTWKLSSWPMNKRFRRADVTDFKLHAFQSGGLIFVHIKGDDDPRLSYLDIYNLRTNRVISAATSFFPNTWSPFYFFRDHVQNEKPKTVYIRVLYSTYAGGTSFGVGQALIEFPTDSSGKKPTILSSQETYFPLPWRPIQKPILHRSRHLTGVILKFRHPQYENAVWQCHCVYDSKAQVLKKAPDYRIFLENDQLWSICFERYSDLSLTTTEPTFAPVFTEGEAIVLRKNWSIWRTSFQPRSLSEISMVAIFGSYGEKMRGFSVRQWKQVTGVALDRHFSEYFAPVYNVGL